MEVKTALDNKTVIGNQFQLLLSRRDEDEEDVRGRKSLTLIL
jgi:hypothetical protein